MKPTCTLDVIRNIVATDLTQFQNETLDKTRTQEGDNYIEHLTKEYGKHPLSVCEQMFLDDIEEEWFDYQELVKGFEESGKIFYLDNQEKIIFAITDKNKEGRYHGAIVHYSPIPNEVFNEFDGEYIFIDEVFFDGIYSGRYELSTNDEELIRKLNVKLGLEIIEG